MNLRVLSVAELEAAEAACWYDDQRPGLGDDFLDQLQQAYGRIRSSPESFPALEEYVGTYGLRRCRLERFPYLVIFCSRAAELLVVAVSHARRRPLYWLKRLG